MYIGYGCGKGETAGQVAELTMGATEPRATEARRARQSGRWEDGSRRSIVPRDELKGRRRGACYTHVPLASAPRAIMHSRSITSRPCCLQRAIR